MPPKSESTWRFLTIDQVAEELNVGIPPVRTLLKSGELRGLRVGARGIWRIGVNDLEDYTAGAYRRPDLVYEAEAH
jgi:prophage regulatory protein